MATLVLAFAGSAIGASIGGTVLGVAAATIGGYIGSVAGRIVDAFLFPPDPTRVTGPRLGDLRVQASTYGVGIPEYYGSLYRAAGNVIWSPGLIEVVNVEQVGKGGPSQEITTYTYHTHVAVALGQRVGDRTEAVYDLRKIYGDGKLIFDKSAVTTPVTPITDGFYTERGDGGMSTPWHLYFYQGTNTQDVNPDIEAALGAGNVPAYRNTCYVVLYHLDLADFGNRIPNLSFEVQPAASQTVEQALSLLAARAGVSVSSIALTVAMDGYATIGPTAPKAAIEQLAAVYSFDGSERAGGMTFIPRGRGAVATVELREMAAHEQGDDRPAPVTVTRKPEHELPAVVVFSAIDPAHDFDETAQRAFKVVAGQASAVNSFAAPIVLSVDRAKEVAEVALMRAWTERTTARIAVTDRLYFLDPAAPVFIELNEGYYLFRIVDFVRGANGVIQLELVAEDRTIYDSAAVGSSGQNKPANVLRVVGSTVIDLIDGPILRDEDDSAGFYVAGIGAAPGWRGWELHRSTDGVTFSRALIESRGANIGNCTTTLGNGPRDTWDRTSSVTVVLIDPDATLSSVTEDDVIYGAENAAFVGGEVIHFATATLTAPSTYVLTNLLRGRRGTSDLIATHAADERFLLIDPQTLRRPDFGLIDLNVARDYKGVSIKQDAADVLAESFTNTGRGLKPFAGVNPRGYRDASSGDWAGEWQPRSRYRGAFWSGGANPIGEQDERYQVDVMNGTSTARTILTTSPAFTYSAAQQTADFGTAQTALNLNIYQLGAAVRGLPLAATLT